MSQLAFDFAARPVMVAVVGWCCGACVNQHHYLTSLIWKPPDYRRGECVYCGRVYQFKTAYGEVAP